MKFSLVLPIFNDLRHGYLERNLLEHSGQHDCEMVCVDAGSTDGSAALIDSYRAKFITCLKSNRAKRINVGIENSQGEWIVILHPRSYLSRACLMELAEVTSVWGAWTHSFNHQNPLLKFTSWYSNHIRGDLRSIFYLDHCLFFHRSLKLHLPLPWVPEVPIFEDTEFCLRLRKIQKGKRLLKQIETSAVRFQKNGVVKQSFINQICKIQYLRRRNLSDINRFYEWGLRLNE